MSSENWQIINLCDLCEQMGERLGCCLPSRRPVNMVYHQYTRRNQIEDVITLQGVSGCACVDVVVVLSCRA
jgi:hypothetical protein